MKAMKKALGKLLLTLTVTGCISCQKPESLKGKEYLAYIEDKDNGLKKKVRAGDLNFTFQYKPAEYVFLKEYGGEAKNEKLLFERQRGLSNTVWFNVSISGLKTKTDPLRTGVADLNEYNARNDYFLMNAMKDFKLIYGNVEMVTAGYHFENNYGLTPMDVMIIGFAIPDSVPVHEMTLVYNEQVFNNGLIKANFSEDDLLSIPKLDY